MVGVTHFIIALIGLGMLGLAYTDESKDDLRAIACAIGGVLLIAGSGVSLFAFWLFN